MQIQVIPYHSKWPELFEELKVELSHLLQEFKPFIEHVGSTSVPGLCAKPVIDILIGLQNTRMLDQAVHSISQHSAYIYYPVFNTETPDRRLFVRLKDGSDLSIFEKSYNIWSQIPHNAINKNRLAHIHIREHDAPDWHRHIAFRNYLRFHPEVRKAYGQLKQELSKKNWTDGMTYNEAKNDFIKTVEQKAIDWYLGGQ